MSFSPSSRLSPAARILQQLSPVKTLAILLDVSERSIFNYRQGHSSPGKRVRALAAARLGIPESLWQQPPDTLEARLTSRLTAIVRAEIEAVRQAANERTPGAQ